MIMAADKDVLRTDLPKIYQKTGDAAIRSERLFLTWSLINFSVLAVGAISSSLKTWFHTSGAIVGAVLLGSGAVMSFWLRRSRYERRWYRSRAVAESVKTLSWRYMTCASPFEGGSSNAEAEASKRFDELVHEIAVQEEAAVPEPHEITPKMREVRQRSVLDRAKLYLKERVGDQRTWYADNAEKNEKMGRRVLYFAVAAQGAACVLALMLIAGDVQDFTGLFATISASALGWMQLKKYEDLAEAYLTAAKELSKIAASIDGTSSDDELSRFVLDAENAISREHTLWIAKRI